MIPARPRIPAAIPPTTAPVEMVVPESPPPLTSEEDGLGVGVVSLVCVSVVVGEVGVRWGRGVVVGLLGVGGDMTGVTGGGVLGEDGEDVEDEVGVEVGEVVGDVTGVGGG
jgi:hypothetical protein